MSLSWPNKDPDDILDYGIDIVGLIDLAGGDDVSAVEWIVPEGLTDQDNSSLAWLDSNGAAVVDHSDATSIIATIWLAGGEDGQSYLVTCRISTTLGRQIDQSIKLKVKTR